MRFEFRDQRLLLSGRGSMEGQFHGMSALTQWLQAQHSAAPFEVVGHSLEFLMLLSLGSAAQFLKLDREIAQEHLQ